MNRTAKFAALLLSAAIAAPGIAAAQSKVTLTAAGSTALLPLVKEAAAAYTAANPSVTINVQGGGSRVGITQAAAKTVDFGMSDIVASKKDFPDLVDNKICVVGFAVVASPDVTVDSLTRQQVADIFTGKITNWKDVGGKDQRITIVNRPRSSGTRAVFSQVMLGGKQPSDQGLVQDATGTVVTTVKTTPGSVSYAAFSGIRNQGLKELKIDGNAPTDDNVTTGKWPIWSYEHIFTNGPPNGDQSKFLAFLRSNSALINKLGYIPIRDMKVQETDR
jgi:phosphate transport system substrate-binding protein